MGARRGKDCRKSGENLCTKFHCFPHLKIETRSSRNVAPTELVRGLECLRCRAVASSYVQERGAWGRQLDVVGGIPRGGGGAAAGGLDAAGPPQRDAPRAAG